MRRGDVGVARGGGLGRGGLEGLSGLYRPACRVEGHQRDLSGPPLRVHDDGERVLHRHEVAPILAVRAPRRSSRASSASVLVESVP